MQPLDGGAERIADREPEHGAARAVVHTLGVAPPDHAAWHRGQWYVRRAWSPWAVLRIGVLQRGHGRPVRR